MFLMQFKNGQRLSEEERGDVLAASNILTLQR